MIENYSEKLNDMIRAEVTPFPSDEDDEDTVTLKGKILRGKGKPKK